MRGGVSPWRCLFGFSAVTWAVRNGMSFLDIAKSDEGHCWMDWIADTLTS